MSLVKSELMKPDLTTVLERESIELRQKGKFFWGLCPLHSEKTPSFKVDPERQTFYCFGCHEHGDVIDFIQKCKGLSFVDSLRYLGISGKPLKPDTRAIKKRELIKAFKQWCYEKHDSLCTLYRELQEVKSLVKTEEDLESLARFYHLESIWLYQIEVLQGNDDESKFELYREVTYGS